MDMYYSQLKAPGPACHDGGQDNIGPEGNPPCKRLPLRIRKPSEAFKIAAQRHSDSNLCLMLAVPTKGEGSSLPSVFTSVRCREQLVNFVVTASRQTRALPTV